MRTVRLTVAAIVAASMSWTASLGAQMLPAPEDFAGFEIGSDGNLVRWERIVDYMKQAGAASKRILTEEVGKTTLGNPFLVMTISSPRIMNALESGQSSPATHCLSRGADAGRNTTPRTGSSGSGADHAQHPLHRDRLVADGARARVSPGHGGLRVGGPRPRERRLPPHPFHESRRSNHGDRLVQRDEGHGQRRRQHALDLPSLYGARQ